MTTSVNSLFQLHHTGIKTSLRERTWLLDFYFNCTIQELKRRSSHSELFNFCYFNCTIQELKPMNRRLLHQSRWDFNCTIQELKR